MGREPQFPKPLDAFQILRDSSMGGPVTAFRSFPLALALGRSPGLVWYTDTV